MRKYIRLTVLLIALFSLLTMFVYRYKYHHLRTILEMMNIFATTKPKNVTCLPKHSNNNIASEIAHKINHWTELFDGVYVYSLHVISKKVISLGYSNGASVNELKKIKCHLWFDSEKKNISSKLDVHLFSGKNSSIIFYFECSSLYHFGNPNAISFIKNDISMTLPVFHKQQYTGPFAACVSPLSPVFNDEYKITEFLIYHSHLGIKHFFLYYTALSDVVSELLISVASECDIIIEFLPWVTPRNFKENKFKLHPFFIDCLFHVSSLNHSDYVLLLDLNNFLVLKETPDIKALVQDNSPFDFLQLKNKVFCLEYPNDLIAEELKIKFNTLLKTEVSNHEGQEMNVIYDMKQLSNTGKLVQNFEKWLLTKNMQNFKKIQVISASIFSYSNCGENSHLSPDISHEKDKEMWSFKQTFFESCIYKHSKFTSTEHVI